MLAHCFCGDEVCAEAGLVAHREANDDGVILIALDGACACDRQLHPENHRPSEMTLLFAGAVAV